MFGLRHLSRNIKRRPLLQCISTTNIKNDETGAKDPSPSNKKNEKAKDPAPDKLSDSQLKTRKGLRTLIHDPVSTEVETVLQSKEAKDDVKNISQKQSREKDSVKILFEDEESPEAVLEEEIRKIASKKRSDARKKLEIIFEKPEPDLEEDIRKTAWKQHLDGRTRLQNLFKKSELSESESLKNEVDVDVQKEKERLKGKLKLQALMQEVETLEVQDKVKLTHPPEKRPVDKVLPKASSKANLDLLKSIKEVATEIGGDVEKTEKELMHAVFEATASEEAEEKRTAEPTSSVGDIVSGMHIDLTKAKPQDRLRNLFDAHEQIQRQRKRFTRKAESDSSQSRESRDYNLFDNEPLKIFNDEYREKVLNKSKDQLVLEAYSAIQKRELEKLVTHSPRNIYEEMIKWTNEGKLWHFPIDNEWKWDWEANVEFTEHILLEQHLEPWCPTGGPIRHFMELVCVGLGKNPYISAEEKRRHIYWFRDYFEGKRKLLEEIGAFGSEQKKIEQSQ